MLTLGNGKGEEIERQDCTVAFSSEQEISLDTRIRGTEYRKVGKFSRYILRNRLRRRISSNKR